MKKESLLNIIDGLGIKTIYMNLSEYFSKE